MLLLTHLPTTAPQLDRAMTATERAEYDYLIRFLKYVERQRPNWMIDKSGVEDVLLVEAMPSLTSSGLFTVSDQTFGGHLLPKICIRRPEPIRFAAMPMFEEIALLAHELGHFRNYQTNGYHAYRQILPLIEKANSSNVGSLSRSERHALWQEEVNAWRRGRKELERCGGFTWWSRLNAFRSSCLATYRVRV